MKPLEDESIDRLRERPDDADPGSDRWRRAMARRDRATVEAVYSAADQPDLPCGWSARPGGDGIGFARHAGERYVVSAERTPDGVWCLRAEQSADEQTYGIEVGGAPTRERALRGLFECMERINAALDDVGLDGHVCLADVLDGVCRYEAGRLAHIVQ
ncbi:hypothetical protein G9464_04810 [Halostella sp. JP-L12]|uniref:hypothetical protein n=1 Tax=Halostella TaxID=1843185 RepID=UPI000EF7C7F5|nr:MULTISPECIES: hypothetical protein [Halostella]NHN46917.1 hypothetical protein [Halostella sp. JP-L12]